MLYFKVMTLERRTKKTIRINKHYFWTTKKFNKAFSSLKIQFTFNIQHTLLRKYISSKFYFQFINNNSFFQRYFTFFVIKR